MAGDGPLGPGRALPFGPSPTPPTITPVPPSAAAADHRGELLPATAAAAADP
ncbi:hypothetical protein [Sphaerimonospora thailandensis]|uniref:hypothetical protein n=1 Tax=Sphaerimonospora thailandensis TaxID=795644 RepID=UPI0019517C37|nr:hypothetical protein [Sphaerimonospora thailandensis]